MLRPKRSKQQIRAAVAAAAARIMAEDGIEDFALAKRKAARQIGVEAIHALPDNSEIEDALRTHQSLYQEAEQRDRIRYLRAQALAAMRSLVTFRPYLRGSVLKGTAGRYGDIDLQLFAADSKSVELYLLNRNLPYEVVEPRRQTGDPRTVTVLKLEWNGIPVNLAVHPENDERLSALGPDGMPLRVNIGTLQRMLEADQGSMGTASDLGAIPVGQEKGVGHDD